MRSKKRLEQVLVRELLDINLHALSAATNPVEGWIAYNDDQQIGVIGAEIFEDTKSVFLHINMFDKKRTPKNILAFAWLITQVVHPLFKARGFVRCVSNCSPENTAVQKFMKLCGAQLKTIVMAEYLL